MENVPALLSSLAHELRTPLSSLRMLADILAESPEAALGEPQRRNVARLREAAGELTRLAEDLSLFARLEGDRVESCPVGVTLSQWATELHAGHSALAHGAGAVLRVEPAEGAAERVMVDRWLCERALEPVVRSAILSSDGGEVTVALATTAPDGDGTPGRLRVAVADSGPPLPPAGGDALFRPFAADSPRTSGERAGSALGFALTRGIARLLGGDVSAADRPGGLTVTLDVPLHGSGE